MLDLKTLRENPDAARAGAIKKRMPDRAAAVDRALAIDAELRTLLPKLDAMRGAQKSSGKELGAFVNFKYGHRFLSLGVIS